MGAAPPSPLWVWVCLRWGSKMRSYISTAPARADRGSMCTNLNIRSPKHLANASKEKYSTALVECAWCRKTLYCSSVCQKQDRQAHKQARGIRSLNMKFALSLPVLHWKRNSTLIACHSHSHCFILIVILIACDSVRSLSLLVMIGSLIQSLHHCLSSFLHYEIVC